MKKNMKYATLIWTLSTLIISDLLFSTNNAMAQDDKPLRIYMDIMCYQKPEGVELKATIRARIGENGKILPVSDLPVNFYNFTDSAEVLLGTVSSNAEGEASISLEKDTDLLWDQKEGYQYMAIFDGDERYRRAKKDIAVREAKIDIAFSEIDSVKMIVASAYEIDPATADMKPIDGVDIEFYVPSSFSLYRVGEGELIDGKCSVNFPVTLPGDDDGNLTVIAKIEESDDYGFVEASTVKNWGRVREPVVPEERRGLGDTDAPLWMVYTLIVLLSAVWIHYLYVFVVIYLIKKDTSTVK